MSWYGGYLTIAHVFLQKHWAQGLERPFQVILIPMLYVLARMVFSKRAYCKNKQTKTKTKTKKQTKRSATTCMVPTYKMFVTSSLRSSRNKLKTKGYIKSKDKKQEQHKSRTMPENDQEKNTSHSKNGTNIKRWQKGSFCKGYTKAKWSQMV